MLSLSGTAMCGARAGLEVRPPHRLPFVAHVHGYARLHRGPNCPAAKLVVHCVQIRGSFFTDAHASPPFRRLAQLTIGLTWHYGTNALQTGKTPLSHQ